MKNRLGLVVLGCVDAGDGLLHECGGVLGAGLLERLKIEHERGETIDYSQYKFETSRSIVTITDVPGHLNFVKNMITGVSSADCAVLAVSAVPYELEDEGQMRAQVELVHALGVSRVIVAVNKMDLVLWDEERFNEKVRDVSALLQEVGFLLDNISFVPISGRTGKNLVDKKGQPCKTLLQAINATEYTRLSTKPLRLPVQDVYKIGGIGTVPMGRVEAGTIKAGMDICFAPSNVETKVMNMESGQILEGYPGDNIAFSVTSNVGYRDIRRGDVVSDRNNHPAAASASFIAQVVILNHPDRIPATYAAVLDCHTARVGCRFEELLEKMDRRTNKLIESNPRFVRTGDCCLVKIVLDAPICVEPYNQYPPLGRFAIRDGWRC